MKRRLFVVIACQKVTKEMALDYHREGKPGKIEVVPTVPLLVNAGPGTRLLARSSISLPGD